MELAVATRTAPRDWWDEPDEVIATALTVLEQQAADAAKGVRKRGHR